MIFVKESIIVYIVVKLHFSDKKTLNQHLDAYDQKTLGTKADDHFVFKEEKANKVTALPEDEAEHTFMTKVQVQKERVSKIRKACKSAEVIQRAWRRYVLKKKKNRGK